MWSTIILKQHYSDYMNELFYTNKDKSVQLNVSTGS